MEINIHRINCPDLNFFNYYQLRLYNIDSVCFKLSTLSKLNFIIIWNTPSRQFIYHTFAFISRHLIRLRSTGIRADEIVYILSSWYRLKCLAHHLDFSGYDSYFCYQPFIWQIKKIHSKSRYSYVPSHSLYSFGIFFQTKNNSEL